MTLRLMDNLMPAGHDESLARPAAGIAYCPVWTSATRPGLVV
jgi:hypothetical protein